MNKQKYRCDLCGKRFDEPKEDACSGCPLKTNCKLIKCPNCNYEFIPGGK